MARKPVHYRVLVSYPNSNFPKWTTLRLPMYDSRGKFMYGTFKGNYMSEYEFDKYPDCFRKLTDEEVIQSHRDKLIDFKNPNSLSDWNPPAIVCEESKSLDSILDRQMRIQSFIENNEYKLRKKYDLDK